MSHPVPPERVLPTLNNDGTRRWVRPKLFKGQHHKRRLIVAWSLIVLFVGLPFVRIGGQPVILLDVPGRKFVLFGATFLPTDGVLLMLLMLSIFVSIFLLTSLLGRVWCGWGCPQTVYMEFVFRPIERWLEGSRGQQLKLDRDGANGRRVIKLFIYAILSVFVGNVFLAYFVGTDRLARWVTQSPFEHPVPFLIVAATSGLVFFDFAYFREQMCTIICPYARLQSVLLDKSSLIVGYDARRGEPRGKGKSAGGDCIDCKACVVACPTGIDIREGLQLECIACTQCIDACDSVMRKIDKPPGLIRYATEGFFKTGEKSRLFRPRVLVYPIMLCVLVGALIVVGQARTGGAEITVLRGIGAPFVEQGQQIRNQLRIKIRNRFEDERAFALRIEGADGSQIITPENPVRVAAGDQVTAGAFVLSPRTLFDDGVRKIHVVVDDGQGFSKSLEYKLLGPFDVNEAAASPTDDI
jgi:cytochrome c oxidase accessory protein FixG